jgi:hypothetical protein
METKMNWIFDTYSNVYSAAMMQDAHHRKTAAPAPKATVGAKLAKLFQRG